MECHSLHEGVENLYTFASYTFQIERVFVDFFTLCILSRDGRKWKKLNSDEQRYCFRFSLPLFHFICYYVRPKQITMRISKNNILMLLNSFLYQLDLLLHKPNGMYSSGTIHTSSAENSWNSKKTWLKHLNRKFED